jgi:hypothetical protein
MAHVHRLTQISAFLVQILNLKTSATAWIGFGQLVRGEQLPWSPKLVLFVIGHSGYLSRPTYKLNRFSV